MPSTVACDDWVSFVQVQDYILRDSGGLYCPKSTTKRLYKLWLSAAIIAYACLCWHDPLNSSQSLHSHTHMYAHVVFAVIWRREHVRQTWTCSTNDWWSSGGQRASSLGAWQEQHTASLQTRAPAHLTNSHWFAPLCARNIFSFIELFLSNPQWIK